MSLIEIFERYQQRETSDELPPKKQLVEVTDSNGAAIEPGKKTGLTAIIEGPKVSKVDFPYNLRHCHQCENLSGGRCLAAFRGEILAAKHYHPVDDVPRRCTAYKSKAARKS